MDFQLRGRVVFFATNNIHKFAEAREVLAEHKLAVGMLKVKALEIQSDDLEEIAMKSVADAFHRCNLPIIVEDAGLFIDSLHGFPGPYSAYVYRTIGNEGLLKLMKNTENRSARFRSVIAYNSTELKSSACFKGEVTGKITKKQRQQKRELGFGFDPIFKPDKSEKTFGEMSPLEKNRYSHRAQALRKFAKWYKGFNIRELYR